MKFIAIVNNFNLNLVRGQVFVITHQIYVFGGFFANFYDCFSFASRPTNLPLKGKYAIVVLDIEQNDLAQNINALLSGDQYNVKGTVHEYFSFET